MGLDPSISHAKYCFDNSLTIFEFKDKFPNYGSLMLKGWEGYSCYYHYSFILNSGSVSGRIKVIARMTVEKYFLTPAGC